MNLYNYNYEPSENLIEHSLLQKAVRRGNVELVEKVFKYLLSIENQDKWLRNRLAVIGYEECWPIANTLDFSCKDNKLLEQYRAIACRVKNKDCDGLAYLAKKLNQGNAKAEIGTNEQRSAIRTIANAINHPDDYWNWIEEQQGYNSNKNRIEAAKKASGRNLMKKDKSIMLSAAYLSIKHPIPDIKIIAPNNSPNFQYWVAIDKHTGEGEDIIGRACEQIKFPKYDGYLLAFYFAGALCNKMQESPFFALAKQFRLTSMGFTTCDQAKEKWLELRPLIVQMTKLKVQLILKKLDNKKEDSDQLSLF